MSYTSSEIRNLAAKAAEALKDHYSNKKEQTVKTSDDFYSRINLDKLDASSYEEMAAFYAFWSVLLNKTGEYEKNIDAFDYNFTVSDSEATEMFKDLMLQVNQKNAETFKVAAEMYFCSVCSNKREEFGNRMINAMLNFIKDIKYSEKQFDNAFNKLNMNFDKNRIIKPVENTAGKQSVKTASENLRSIFGNEKKIVQYDTECDYLTALCDRGGIDAQEMLNYLPTIGINTVDDFSKASKDAKTIIKIADHFNIAVAIDSNKQHCDCCKKSFDDVINQRLDHIKETMQNIFGKDYAKTDELIDSLINMENSNMSKASVDKQKKLLEEIKHDYTKMYSNDPFASVIVGALFDNLINKL